MKTHIRRVTATHLTIYCRATPVETISYEHYVQSLVAGSAQAGHVATLPSPLCAQCVQRIRGK